MLRKNVWTMWTFSQKSFRLCDCFVDNKLNTFVH